MEILDWLDAQGTPESHQARDEIVRLRTETANILALANDARDAWDNDQDTRVGKLLLAMIDDEFRATYRPDRVTPPC